MIIKTHLNKLFSGKRVAILGFGREGRSTYTLLKHHVHGIKLMICDKNPHVRLPDDLTAGNEQIHISTGPGYLSGIAAADVIIKSPGIPFSVLDGISRKGVITSQTEIFLSLYRRQVTGITGTKGKSTTASLLYQILERGGKDVVLLGNIGVPCFDMTGSIGNDTVVVFEMSSHQLEGVKLSPSLAILLNIFEEHLDHYASYESYQQAKLNIVRWQAKGDLCIYNSKNNVLERLIPRLDTKSKTIMLGGNRSSDFYGNVFFDGDDLVCRLGDDVKRFSGLSRKRMLAGEHNLVNISAAVAAAVAKGVDAEVIEEVVGDFRGLPHRLEYAGSYRGVVFYNDSIATIPEATLAAVDALPDTATLILGGKDRGVHIESLMEELSQSGIYNFVFTGDAGERMMAMAEKMHAFRDKHLYMADSFDDAVTHAARITSPGKICLLSPAATSYDAFPDFEARGNRFKELVKTIPMY